MQKLAADISNDKMERFNDIGFSREKLNVEYDRPFPGGIGYKKTTMQGEYK